MNSVWTGAHTHICRQGGLFPFGLESFCEATPLVDHSANYTEFDKAVRNAIVYLLLGLFLYVTGHFLVFLFLKRKDDDNDDYEKGSASDYLTTFVCASSVGISVGAIMQIPITIVSNEALVYISQLRPEYSWYVAWVDARLIIGLWNCVSVASNVALFMLLPFAYFYREAEHVRFSVRSGLARLPNRPNTPTGRGLERALVLVVLWWCAIGGLIFVLLALLGHLPPHRYDVLSYLPYLHFAITMAGAAIFFRCVPVGCLRLVEVGWGLRMPALLRRTIRQQWLAARLELDSMKAAAARRKGGDQTARLEAAQIEVDRLSSQLEKSPWKWNMTCVLVIGVSVLLAGALVSRLGMHFVRVVLGRIEGTGRGRQDLREGSWYGRHSVSMFGVWGALFELVLVLYYMGAGMLGLYSLLAQYNYSPRVYSLTRTQLLAHSTFLLILSSALPWLTWNVGVTEICPVGLSEDPFSSESWWVVAAYNAFFLWYAITHWIRSPVYSMASLLLSTLRKSEPPEPHTPPSSRRSTLSSTSHGSAMNTGLNARSPQTPFFQ